MFFCGEDLTFAICAYKESEYLEQCIKSVMEQSLKAKVFIATSTPNDHITSLAQKYRIPVFINEGQKGIGGDWNFAYNTADTALVTLAHQDDIYEKDYAKQITAAINKAKNPIIAFSGYGELRDNKKVYKTTNLFIKKILLAPLKIKALSSTRFAKRFCLAFGNAICCPAVTYVKAAIGDSRFTNDFESNIDWQFWEHLSNKKGEFVYEKHPLMCHRIHKASTTSLVLGENKRTGEDLAIFEKFWPKKIAKLLTKAYASSEKSNN